MLSEYTPLVLVLLCFPLHLLITTPLLFYFVEVRTSSQKGGLITLVWMDVF